MMLFVDAHTDTYRATVRIAHTETAMDSAIVERARLHYAEDCGLGHTLTRADDMSGERVFEVATVTFYRD
jgi:hypothetical protein